MKFLAVAFESDFNQRFFVVVTVDICSLVYTASVSDKKIGIEDAFLIIWVIA